MLKYLIFLGLGGDTKEQKVQKLVDKIEELKAELVYQKQ